MRSWITTIFAAVVVVGLVWSCNEDDNFWESMIPETNEETTTAQVAGYVFKPALVPATDENVQQLRVPEGFAVTKFAENLGKPRILVVSDAGNLYASDREAGVVMLIQDTNDDGVADQTQTVATIEGAHGLAIYNDQMYVVAVNEAYRADINTDGTLGEPQMILENLPDGGQHPNRTIDFGPDGKMYITVGSTCNACAETRAENATVIVANPDGSGRRIFASGLRNTIGFDWHPETQELWGLDHGIDWLGDNEQIEELNRLVDGADYGWPYIYGNGNYNPADRPPGDTTYQQYLAKTTLPVLGYQAHSAPMALLFYTGDQFPAEYQNNAFATMRGSWNRSEPVGYKIVRIRFEEGEPTQFEDFLTGFLVENNTAHFARPVGLTLRNDGSLLMSDDTNGVIYRIVYQP